MQETWLRPNRRAILFGCAPPLVLAALGTWLDLGIEGQSSWLRWLGVLMIVTAIATIAALLRQMKAPATS